ncbi:MAG TPA: hypothetical protein ENG69_01170 [Candidatus Korarchaeota archaeon]|mgnify:CR=1 FL=1|nr:hypothetical protein [Candidatus Korarchaeota archaeon]
MRERLSLEEAGRFHGHLGPYLTLGYLAGDFAVNFLKPETELDLRATVRVPLRRPYTCFVDGVQCSSRCTMGKLNIEVLEGDGIEVEFRNTKTGKAARLRVRDAVLSAIQRTPDMRSAVEWILARDLEEIFEALVDIQ